VKVEPLPAGTTDVPLEAGWSYIDQRKIIVYGAVNPLETIEEKLARLEIALLGSGLKDRTADVRNRLRAADYRGARRELLELMVMFDGCRRDGRPDGDDRLKDCDAQARSYWPAYEASVLLNMLL
jgi:hypothetical protein